MKKDNYIIRRMQSSEELDLAIRWAAQEGWNPGLQDSKTFYQADRNGFFLGELDGEPIAVGSMVCYNRHVAFSGLYIVKPEFRGKGYGWRLTQARTQYAGDRLCGLDGVLENVDKYARIGFKKAYLSTRYQGIAPEITTPHSALMPLTNIALNDIISYEKPLFPAPRPAFLDAWIKQEEAHALGYIENQQLKGYTVVRPAQSGYKVGPLFADTLAIAEHLLLGIFSKISGQPVSVDVPEINKESIQLMQKYALQPGFQVARMYRNGIPMLDIPRIYGLTSFELG